MKRFFASLVCLFPIAAITVACSSAGGGVTLDPTEAKCRTVCEKAHDCLSQDVNTETCANDCTGKAKDSNEYKAKVEDCDSCVSGKECTEAKSCTGECLKAYLSNP